MQAVDFRAARTEVRDQDHLLVSAQRGPNRVIVARAGFFEDRGALSQTTRPFAALIGPSGSRRAAARKSWPPRLYDKLCSRETPIPDVFLRCRSVAFSPFQLCPNKTGCYERHSCAPRDLE